VLPLEFDIRLIFGLLVEGEEAVVLAEEHFITDLCWPAQCPFTVQQFKVFIESVPIFIAENFRV